MEAINHTLLTLDFDLFGDRYISSDDNQNEFILVTNASNDVTKLPPYRGTATPPIIYVQSDLTQM